MSFNHFAQRISFSHYRAKLVEQQQQLSRPFHIVVWSFAYSYEINLDILLSLQHKSLIWSNSHNHVKCLHDHANMQHLVFELFFVLYSIFFFWLHFNYPEISYKFQSNLIILLLPLCIWIIINIICIFQIDSSLSSTIYQNHTLK